MPDHGVVGKWGAGSGFSNGIVRSSRHLDLYRSGRGRGSSHLQDQLLFVRDRDPELHGLILAIQKEELMHLHYAEERLPEGKFLSPILGALISGATDFAIWLSTWGDSSQMAKELAAAKQAS